MDIIKAANLKDAIVLSLVFFASFFLANTLNQTAVIIYQEKFSSQDRVRDWLIYTLFVVVFFVLFIYILRISYRV